MDVDAEALTHVVLDGLAEVQDVGTSGPSPIDEHQGLTVVNASRPSERPFHPHWSIIHPAGIFSWSASTV